MVMRLSVSAGFSPTQFPLLLWRFLRNPDVEKNQGTPHRGFTQESCYSSVCSENPAETRKPRCFCLTGVFANVISCVFTEVFAKPRC